MITMSLRSTVNCEWNTHLLTTAHRVIHIHQSLCPKLHTLYFRRHFSVGHLI